MTVEVVLENVLFDVVLDYPQTRLGTSIIIDDSGGQIVVDDSTGQVVTPG